MTKYIIRTVVLSTILSSGCAPEVWIPTDLIDPYLIDLIRSEDQPNRRSVIKYCEDLIQSSPNHDVEYACDGK